MIPRHQTVLFVILLLASVIMGAVLWNQLRRAHERLLRGQDAAPTQAPLVAPAEQATLMVANDADNSIDSRILTLPLPENPEARARAVLGKLLDLYAAPDATHPVPGGASSVAQVFLVPIADDTGKASPTAPHLAVVNLTSAFAAGHPSGLQAETLTVLSICATLNANMPSVTQVRFLVDGQSRATLAGHADLTRTYPAVETAPQP
ncbi:MAG: GerMN domain-containing protein [Terracidiphilus sp.]|nr:GerMN domain-containing protein [Terracidiphilus sp.]MDR3797523.1 GerMN domain-containing protein [Terracidiphilus sp.]